MKTLKQHSKAVRPYCITEGDDFHLKEIHPDDTGGIHSKDKAAELLAEGVKKLAAHQEKLYAQDSWALLLIFQAMDAAGKDSTIKHVMSGVNPQGCEVTSFKAPSTHELNHDFLWRATVALPERGRIGIFNRSYYEEALVVRVHQTMLAKQKIPASLVTKHIWKERFEDINAYEKHLTRSGTVIRKFFLHVSKEEQKKRFLARLDENRKNWKFSAADMQEREYWYQYQSAYEKMIRHTATEYAPWYVIPADNKWYTRFIVASVIIETLASLDLHFPKVDTEMQKELATARATLLGEK